VAAAVFGDGSKVKFTPLSAKERFTALQSGEVDILSRNTTWTINRDTALGLNFIGTTYYDGQGFMINAKKLPGVNSALQLSGAAVCVQSGTTTELNLADYFKSNKMEYNPVVFEKLEEVNAAYDAGRCDVYTTDQSGLYGIRLTLGAPADHVVLPEIISKEPLGPAVRQGDDQWY
ncbi:MAG: amino acid ABC transporter substrate-binding protein, partial [Mesorhizobium sp.]